MIGVLVTDENGNVQKRIYQGDDDTSKEVVASDMKKNPTYTFEIHQDTDPDWQESFMDAKETIIVTKSQTDWQIAKAVGSNAAISFLAKRLGLE